jgi:2-dehydropantoate 2-reductase
VASKNLLIVGTGALATLFAARLSATGMNITLLGTWREALEAFNLQGAQVEGTAAFPIRATNDPAECGRARLALVLVKSWQTERAAGQLAACLAPDGLAISLQNGLGNDSVLARTLGRPRVGVGVTTLGASLVTPGIVRMAGDGPLWLERRPRIDPLADMLREAGFAVEVVDDIRPRVWGKLVVNAAINPLTALLRVKNGDLLTDPQARGLMHGLAREAAAVAKAHGVALPFQGPESAAEEVAERTRENLSSMLRDVLRGAPTEVDAINGEVVKHGETYYVAVPVNRLVWELMKKQSRLSSAELSDMVRLGQS